MLAIIYYISFILQPSILKSKLPLPTILYPLCYVHECIFLVWSTDTHISWSRESSQNHFCWFTRSSSGLSFWSSLIMSSTKVVCMHEFIVLTLQILSNWWRIEDILAWNWESSQNHFCWFARSSSSFGHQQLLVH